MKIISFTLLVLVLAACSSNRNIPGQSGVIVDTKGVNMGDYQQDLYECQAYADQVPLGEKAATGAVAGAAVGAVLGAIVGNSDTAEKAAGVGAVGGAVKGTGRGLREKNVVVKRCLRGRGYKVLN